MKRVSISEISTYHRCHLRRALAYDRKLRPLKDHKSPLTVGSLIHSGMEFSLRWLHEHGYAMDKTFARDLRSHLYNESLKYEPVPDITLTDDGGIALDYQDSEEFLDVVESTLKIVLRTIDYLNIPENWRVVEIDGTPIIEYEFSIDIDGGQFIGKVDTVMRNLNDGLVYLIDWKSRKVIQTEDRQMQSSAFNVQVSLYQQAMALLGVETHATKLFFIRTELPKQPKVLKSGKAVSRQAIITDWETYANTLKEMGFNPDDYAEEMIPKLENIRFWAEADYFESEQSMASRWVDMQDVAKEIWDTSTTDLLSVTRNEQESCMSCPYAIICQARTLGVSIDDIISEQYEARDYQEVAE